MARANTAVTFTVRYPDRHSRATLLAKTLLGWLYIGIPHGIILQVYGALAAVSTLVAFIGILITGRYPAPLFHFVVGYYRWTVRVAGYQTAYLVDDYPPFYPGGSHSVSLNVQYPPKLSRRLALLKLLLGWLYVGLPHGIVLILYGILMIAVLFLSWWSILIFGTFPRFFFDFVTGFYRWQLRVNVYLSLLRDEYPPFHGRA